MRTKLNQKMKDSTVRLELSLPRVRLKNSKYAKGKVGHIMVDNQQIWLAYLGGDPMQIDPFATGAAVACHDGAIEFLHDKASLHWCEPEVPTCTKCLRALAKYLDAECKS